MYKLSIITPEKVIFEDDVISLIAPGALGYLEILTDHAAIITSLQAGKVMVTTKDSRKLLYAISGGFLEVVHNNANLLADAIEQPSEIDIKRAEEAFQRALNIIQSENSKGDIERAKQAFKRAENRINVYQEYKELHRNSVYG